MELGVLTSNDFSAPDFDGPEYGSHPSNEQDPGFARVEDGNDKRE